MADTSQVQRLRDLLSQAVQCLGNSGNSANSPSQSAVASTSRAAARGTFQSTRDRRIHTERNTLFNFGARGPRRLHSKGGSKKKKVSTWSHEFVCLASKDQDKTPTAHQRSVLMSAGLGKKTICFLEDSECDEIKWEIVESFPKLKEAGGYELLRVGSRSRSLEVIPIPPGGYTVQYLKEVVQQAKIYVRPIQADLDVSSDISINDEKEKCLNCGLEVNVAELRKHRETCEENKGSCEATPIIVKGDSDSGDDGFPEVFFNTTDVSSDIAQTESDLVDYVVTVSQEQENVSVTTPDFKSGSPLKDILANQRSYLGDEVFEFQVRRGHVLEDLLKEMRKKSFNPFKRITTWFVGELGRDTGGVTREMWRLLGKDIQMLCEGQNGKLVFRYDSTKVQDGVYKKIGVLVGMSFVQGGSGYPFFAPSFYEYIAGHDVCKIYPDVEEIPDYEVKKCAEELYLSKDDEDLRKRANDMSDCMIQCGITKPLALLKVEDIKSLVQSISLHATLLKVKGALDQFVDGLNEASILPCIKKHPHIFRELFVKSATTILDPDIILNLFEDKKFSPTGSSANAKEQDTYIFFKDLLSEIENGETTEVALEDILSFFTGSDAVPVMGFPVPASLNFNDHNPYPTASTCSLSLTLPSKYNSFSEFKENFIFAILNHGGFGLY